VTLLAWVAMTAAGALGAYARFRLAAVLAPRGILAVNLSGAFAAGVVAGAGLGATALLILATGFLGAYTTFSTWMVERRYVMLSTLAGLALAWAGWALGSAV
jgi:fluoride exporter